MRSKSVKVRQPFGFYFPISRLLTEFLCEVRNLWVLKCFLPLPIHEMPLFLKGGKRRHESMLGCKYCLFLEKDLCRIWVVTHVVL